MGSGNPEVCPRIWCLPLASPTATFPPQQSPTTFGLKFAEDLGKVGLICSVI